MRISPFAPIALPVTIATTAAFLPTLAALWARRSLVREPAGQIAVCWFVMALVGSVGFVRYFLYGLEPQVRGNAVVAVLFPVLLIPPTFSWAGGVLKRWQWLTIAVWVLLWLVASIELIDPRLFKTAIDPLMSVLLLVVSAWAMAAQVHRTSSAVTGTDWFWILLGHVIYFVTTIFRMPLTEVLASHDRNAALYVNASFMILYSVVYVLIARGMLVTSDTYRPTRIQGVPVQRIA